MCLHRVKHVILPPPVFRLWICLLSVITYLIYQQASLGWFGVQWENIQVGSGGETWFDHSNQGILRYTCNLGSKVENASHVLNLH